MSRPRWLRLPKLRRFPALPVAALLLVLVVPAVFSPWLMPHSPTQIDLAHKLRPPFWMEGGSTVNLLGTDDLGRDILSRIIDGSRVTVSLVLLGIMIGAGIGVTAGLVSGWVGRWVDNVIMRVVDLFFAVPLILLALALGVVLGPSYTTVIIVVTVAIWARYARQVRAETLALRNLPFVDLARIAGISPARAMRKHILPNVANTIIVLTTLEVGAIILLEASLSFLGIGIPPPRPTWGRMIAEGRALIVTAWWVSLFPGIALSLTVLSLNLLGDWLRDRLDPKLRQL